MLLITALSDTSFPSLLYDKFILITIGLLISLFFIDTSFFMPKLAFGSNMLPDVEFTLNVMCFLTKKFNFTSVNFFDVLFDI